MFENFFTSHPHIYKWKMKMKDDAARLGYAEAPHGRRRRFPIFDLYRDEYGRFDQNKVPRELNFLVAEALRQASNAPIQGIASDAAMIGATLFMRECVRPQKKNWILQNAVHDSAVFQVPVEEIPEAVQAAEHWFSTGVMEFMNAVWGIDFILPLEVEMEIGLKWGELDKWNYHPSSLVEIQSDIRNHWAALN